MTLIDKVITEESAKILNVTGIIDYLDSFIGDDQIQYENPIKVHNEDGQLIGFANIEVLADSSVRGVFSINYSTPERLNIQTSIPTYPICYYTRWVTDEGKTIVNFNSIVLSSQKPLDERIQPLA